MKEYFGRVRRVSPLLFIAAFDYAPYPGTAGLRFSLSRLPCVGLHPRGFTVSSIDNGSPEAIHRCHCPQWQGIMRPQPSGIIALAYRGKRFCVRARTLALSHFGIRVSSGGGTFLTTCGRGGCSSSLDYYMSLGGIICCRVRAVEMGSSAVYL